MGKLKPSLEHVQNKIRNMETKLEKIDKKIIKVTMSRGRTATQLQHLYNQRVTLLEKEQIEA